MSSLAMAAGPAATRVPTGPARDPLHRCLGVGLRDTQRIQVGELPRRHLGGRRDVPFDEPGARRAESAVAVVEKYRPVRKG